MQRSSRNAVGGSRRHALPLVLALAAATALLALPARDAAAQRLIEDDPDWKELDTPQPPAFDLGRLVEFEVDRQSPLRFGIDPQTVQIGKDGVIRYVIVAHRPEGGAVNAMYEGLRCASGEMRTYARFNADSGWRPVAGRAGDWQKLVAGSAAQRPTLAFARAGGCVGNGPPSSVRSLVQSLR